jgi:bifunctional UDP-N-acetylglucosamine pyrophosphorylase/glucosamine-1-phosphate N-acetyltransferase
LAHALPFRPTERGETDAGQAKELLLDMGAMETAVVLAAGQGTRMKSALPKVMHRVCGLPLIHFVVQAALDAGCNEVVVVVGHGRTAVEDYLRGAFSSPRVRTAVQEQQRGTGDAAQIGLWAASPGATRVFVVNGDIPLVRGEDLRSVAAALDDATPPADLAFATCVLDDPAGYGRVLRVGSEVVEIREDRDLRSSEERAVGEINAGLYVAGAAWLRTALGALAPDNAQRELYLTDVVSYANRTGKGAATARLSADVLAGVNDRQQLVEVEHTMHERLVRKWRLAGATLRDGARVDATVTLEPDATVEQGAVLRGTTHVARGATVDVGCVLTNVLVGADAVVKPYSVGTDSRIGPRAQVGPFAHLRPQTELGEEAHIGNFVETKKTKMGRRAKANHLAYLGDGVIGDGANVGAGTIFCNYDGVQKHTTTIEPGAFIGSDSQLVAPVTIGRDAYVATGTTVTRDVPPEALAIGRMRQENKDGYAPKLRARLRAQKDAKAK